MNSIEVSTATYEKLLVAAQLMGCTAGQVVDRMVSNLSGAGSGTTSIESTEDRREAPVVATPATGEAQVPVFKIYKNHRIEGVFDMSTHELRITTAPWNHKVFPSPTAAAVDVVVRISGDTRAVPNTNGRKFWKVKSTGDDLRSLIGER
ncbi:hypothetical protein [Demequina zhanjiangensis]|uniref:Uncharacterized protein n=1 Tax=Demequina zhanjiangensis TaxID=3051659 RepID=A0ABT8G3K1_9MICO|nr:hypothetical protein [Demequina sp. SYSU T00b26]MDN4473716.1 hypothetical protein [Demequina sp. SYSU T00b26]